MSAKKVAIIGQGYVGLPLAMAATSSGWDVAVSYTHLTLPTIYSV